MGAIMILDTLVVVVCLMADIPRIHQVKLVPANRFTEQFREADRVADRATRFEQYHVLGIISQEEYTYLKRAKKELDEMKVFNRKAGGKP